MPCERFYDRERLLYDRNNIHDYLKKERGVNEELATFIISRENTDAFGSLLWEIGLAKASERGRWIMSNIESLKKISIGKLNDEKYWEKRLDEGNLGDGECKYLLRNSSTNGEEAFNLLLTRGLSVGYNMEEQEHSRLIGMMWKCFFLPDPVMFFKKYKEIEFWRFPDIANLHNGDGVSLEPGDFKQAEIEMHKVPRIFEILDYYKEETQYKYNDEFKTHCCHFKDIPYFHFAMDPCSMNMSENIFVNVNLNSPGFLEERYPRFFEPESSVQDGYKFISEGERKLAFLLRKHFMGENDGEYEDFQGGTDVV